MIKVIIIIAVLAWLADLSKTHPIAVGFSVLVGIAILIFSQNEKKKQARKKAEQDAENEKVFWVQVNKLLADHTPTLARKEKQLVSQDDYGNYQFDKWFREIDYFIENVVTKASNLAIYFAHFPITPEKHSALRTAIINLVFEYQKKEHETDSFVTIDVDSLDPIQFEHYCSELLGKSGWISRVTQANGDQGIDVIANFGNIKAVFQCKKYSQPVGNSAVQEVIAGKVFEQANVAAVVTNSTFTPSARQLAASADVHLLHFSELPIFAEKLRLV